MNASWGIVIVTGAGRGIGRQTALSLCRDHGASVLAVGRNEDHLRHLVAETAGMQGALRTIQVDLTSANAIPAIIAALGGDRVSGLVNNAGLLMRRSFGNWTMADLEEVFRVNAHLPFMLAQALCGHFTDPRAHVVNIASMGGFQGAAKFPGLAGYSASKAALVGYTECLAEEMKQHGVHCNCLALGAVDTEMFREAFPEYQAPVSATEVGKFIARFALEGHNLFNGKVLPLALSTP
ncbi:MAG: SDR family oxidoreductase [Flavobacteriales bacterium]|nr:SDR family oxidoreductase [Flavobacteriales bacterium]